MPIGYGVNKFDLPLLPYSISAHGLSLCPIQPECSAETDCCIILNIILKKGVWSNPKLSNRVSQVTTEEGHLQNIELICRQCSGGAASCRDETFYCLHRLLQTA